MKTKPLIGSLAAMATLLLAGATSLAGDIDPDLRTLMEDAPRGSTLSVLVFMGDPIDIGP